MEVCNGESFDEELAVADNQIGHVAADSREPANVANPNCTAVQLVDLEQEPRLPEWQDYCPYCSHFNTKTSVCRSTLYRIENQESFQKHCNGDKYVETAFSNWSLSGENLETRAERVGDFYEKRARRFLLKPPAWGEDEPAHFSTDQSRFNKWIVVLIVFAGLAFIGLFLPKSKDLPNSSSNSERQVIEAVHDYVERVAKNPKSIEFFNEQVRLLSTGDYEYMGDIEGTNSYGATIRDHHVYRVFENPQGVLIVIVSG